LCYTMMDNHYSLHWEGLMEHGVIEDG
jgi:hypothetical protein